MPSLAFEGMSERQMPSPVPEPALAVFEECENAKRLHLQLFWEFRGPKCADLDLLEEADQLMRYTLPRPILGVYAFVDTVENK
eukprot:50424-Amphidinium_carterae.1